MSHLLVCKLTLVQSNTNRAIFDAKFRRNKCFSLALQIRISSYKVLGHAVHSGARRTPGFRKAQLESP